MHQMKAKPIWRDGEEAGTGQLNYVCHDRSLRVVSAKVTGDESGE
jgi:hypothetical protein